MNILVQMLSQHYKMVQIIIEYPSTFTICISVVVNIRVKLRKVHHVQLPRFLKNPVKFDNKQ